MKKTVLSILCFFSVLLVNAQTFTNAVGGAIADNNTYIIFPIVVSGLPTAINTSTFGLESVKFNIIHPNDSDLRIKLRSPTGSLYVLTSLIGGTGDNYTNTTFTDTAAISINSGTPPFTGFFKPVDNLVNFNNGQNPNGTWTLEVKDQVTTNVGSVQNWSITFGSHPSGGLTFTSSNLPIVVINTGGVTIPDEPKVPAQMGIIYNGPGVRNYFTDPFNNYNNKIGIELRGSSSQSFPQKPYGFETRDINGLPHDTMILGMPAQSDWILYAPYDDKTCMRNLLSYEIANKTGHYASRTKLCELVVDGQYQGIYVVMEKIKRDSMRCDVAKLDSNDLAGDSLTGGYIIKVDKTTGNGGAGWTSAVPSATGSSIFIQYHYPSEFNILPAQSAYIKSYVDSFETALNGPNFADPNIGYRKYASTGSFIDYFILDELSKNVDGYRISSYLHKDKNSKGGKLKAGPAWDYNLAWWNANYCSGSVSTGWEYNFNVVCPGDGLQNPFWWAKFLQDPAYCTELRCRWNQLRQTTLSVATMNHYIDSVAALLAESQVRHFTRWPILGVYTWPNPTPIPTTFAGEIQALKDWIVARTTWMDANLPGTCTPSVAAFYTNTPSVCAGDSVKFHDNSTLYPTSWSWSFPGGSPSTSTLQNPKILYTTPGVYSVTLTATNPGGTGAPVTMTSYITVNALPSVTVNSPSLCIGQPATLTGSGANTYLWSTTAITNPISVSPSVTTSYTVTGTNTATGCINTAVSTVTVNALPVVNAGASIILCNVPVPTTLTGFSPSGGTWTGAGVTTGGVFTPSAPGNFVLTYTYTNSITTCSNSDTMVVTVANNAVVNAGAGFHTCPNSSIVSLGGAPSGGVWSGTGVAGNTFNPVVAGIGNYILTYSYNQGTCSGSDTIMVTVNSLPTISVNSPTTCPGQSTTLTATGGNSFVWSTTAITSSINVSPLVTTSYTVTGTNTSTGCANTASSTVNVNSLPVVNAGTGMVLCNVPVTTTLTGYSPAGGTWTGSGVTTSGDFTPPGAGQFTLTYTYQDAFTTCTNSDTVLVTVVNSQLADAGTGFNTCANGTPITLSGLPALGGVWSGAGVSGTDFDPSIAGLGNFVLTYSFGSGNCLSTDTIMVSVVAAPIVAVNSPAVCAGSTVTLTALGGTSYLWSTTEITSTIDVSPLITTNYTVTGTDGTTGCSSVGSSTVTVNSLPVVDAGATQTLCNQPIATTLTGFSPAGGTWTGSGVTTSGDFTPPGVGNYVLTFSYQDAISGCSNADTMTVLVVASAVADAGTGFNVCGNAAVVSLSGLPANGVWTGTGVTGNSFDPTASGAGNFVLTYSVGAGICLSTDTIMVSVASIPVITVNSPSICSGQSATLTASGAGSYLWSTTETTDSITVSPAVTTSYTVTGTTNGCAGNSATATVTINPSPDVTAQTDQTLCNASSTAALVFSGSVPGTIFNWTNSNTAIGLAANGIGNIPSFNTTNTSTSDITATITVTPVIGTCSGTPITFTITVNPSPTVDIVTNQSLCNGVSSLPVNFTSPVAGTSFNWTNTATSIGLAANGVGNIGLFPVTNTGTTTVTATITVTPVNGSCTGTPMSFTITVYPTPTVDLVANQTVCEGATIAPITFTSPLAGATFIWSNSDPSIGLGANGAGNLPSFVTNNPTSNPLTATITVSPTTNGCLGILSTFTITVNPNPVANAGAVMTIACNGNGTITLDGTGSDSGSGITYNWTTANGNIVSGATTTQPVVNQQGVYTLTVTNSTYGCSASDTTSAIGGTGAAASFTTSPNPAVGFVPLNIQFTNTTTNANIYQWNFGDGSTYNGVDTSHIFTAAGTYVVILTASNSGMCPSTSEVTVVVYDDYTLIIPNVFTPNGDGVNDVFTIISKGVAQIDVEIFDRTGLKIYEWNNLSGSWDGRTGSGLKSVDGTYYYVITATDVHNIEHSEKGFFMLAK